VIDATTVRRVGATCAAFLGGHIGRDWSAPIPGMEMTPADAVAHAANCCLWYAVDLAAAGADLEHVEIGVGAAAPGALIASLVAGAGVVAATIEAAPEGTIGFHPWGDADAAGFAGMACDELLIHTDDAARGLGVEFEPPADLAEAVLRRLFPEVDPVTDPWQQLRWANGRIELDGAPRREQWRWFCRPLSEWPG
jgi:hypothetical protein